MVLKLFNNCINICQAPKCEQLAKSLKTDTEASRENDYNNNEYNNRKIKRKFLIKLATKI